MSPRQQCVPVSVTLRKTAVKFQHQVQCSVLSMTSSDQVTEGTGAELKPSTNQCEAAMWLKKNNSVIRSEVREGQRSPTWGCGIVVSWRGSGGPPRRWCSRSWSVWWGSAAHPAWAGRAAGEASPEMNRRTVRGGAQKEHRLQPALKLLSGSTGPQRVWSPTQEMDRGQKW